MISPEEYVEQRINDQIGWYDRKSTTNQRWFKRLRFAEIVAAAAIPFLSGCSACCNFRYIGLSIEPQRSRSEERNFCF